MGYAGDRGRLGKMGDKYNGMNKLSRICPTPFVCILFESIRPVCAQYLRNIPRLQKPSHRLTPSNLYDYNNSGSALTFLEELHRCLPFAIQRIQTDNDSSFGQQFTWDLADLGIEPEAKRQGRTEPQDR